MARAQASQDGLRMRVEALEAGKGDGHGSDVLEALAAQLLDRHGAQEIADAEARIAMRIAVGRQYVVRAAAIVADRLGRPSAEKHGTGRLHAVEPETRTLELQNQVPGGIRVRNLAGLPSVRS